MRVPSALALAVTVVALAVPPAALAQGAGDDQYTDPFGTNGSASATPTPAAPPATPAPSAPAPAAPAPPAASAAPAGSSSQAAPAASAAQLPYTGSPVDAGLLAAAGGVLLASGLTLRLRERDGA
jgi:hypothetical protein